MHIYSVLHNKIPFLPSFLAKKCFKASLFFVHLSNVAGNIFFLMRRIEDSVAVERIISDPSRI